MKSIRDQTAMLIIIADSNDQDFGKCTYVLNLLNKKLSAIYIRLIQVFIGYESTICFADQLRWVGVTKIDWILVTSTNELNDQAMVALLEENNNVLQCRDKVELLGCVVPVYNRNVFVLESTHFCRRLAAALKYMQLRTGLNGKHLVSFKSSQSMDEFVLGFNKLFGSDAEGVEMRRVFSNYSQLVLELSFFERELWDAYGESGLAGELVDGGDLLEDNFVNADFYVYELESCLSFLDTSSDDILYLHSKIDRNVFIAKLQQTIQIIEQAFKDYKPDELCVSFNGGKDCCVILYIAFAVALKLGIRFPLNAVLIQIKNQFKEMEDFVRSLIETKYTQRFVEFIYFADMKPMKESLRELKETRPQIKAILIGTRRSDGPYFKDLEPFAYTDGDWPRYMRVNPILDWTYCEIWYFIRLLKLPYCSLYDNGYTSIDSTLNTVPNKELLAPNGIDYLPAWMLQNQSSERFSRKKN